MGKFTPMPVSKTGRIYAHACSSIWGTMGGLNLGELVVKTADLEPGKL